MRYLKWIVVVILLVGVSVILSNYKNVTSNLKESDTNQALEKSKADALSESIVPVELEKEVSSSTVLSNKTYAWGFRRMKDGLQPEFTSTYTKILDDYDGMYVGNKNEKVVYLTFDEGYENGYTDTILDVLKEKKVSATFFITKPYVKANATLVKRMIDEGHIVGNHTPKFLMS